MPEKMCPILTAAKIFAHEIKVAMNPTYKEVPLEDLIVLCRGDDCGFWAGFVEKCGIGK